MADNGKPGSTMRRRRWREVPPDILVTEQGLQPILTEDGQTIRKEINN